jgi:Leucine-rich repeat (LRR) protein
LSNNVIENLSPKVFVSLTSLADLSLQGNLIRSLDVSIFESLLSLQKLSIQKNYIKEPDESLLANLTSLRVFSIANNILQTLHEDFFVANLELHSIYLQENLIKTLSSKLFCNQKHLEIVNLSGNRCIKLTFKSHVLGLTLEEFKGILDEKCGLSTKQPSTTSNSSVIFYNDSIPHEGSDEKINFYALSKFSMTSILVCVDLVSMFLLAIALKSIQT